MRRFRHSPGFTIVAVLTLAAGIACVVAMITVYWQVILHPVTAPDPATLLSIARLPRGATLVPATLSWPRVQAIRRGATTLSAVGAYSTETVALSEAGVLPRELRGLRVSAGFFDAIQAVPLRGRLFTSADDLPNGPAVCLLAFDLWQSRFGGRDVIGSVVRLSGRPTEIVGVLRPHLSAPWADREIFLPRVFDDSQLTAATVAAGASWLSVVGRLAPSRTLAQATDDLHSLSRDYATRFAGRSDALLDLQVRPLGEVLADARRPALTLLLGAVFIVLIVASANASALFLSRLVARQREFAVRQALGATRGIVARELLLESLTLAALAGIAGVLLAAGALAVIQAVLGAALPPGLELRLGAPSLAVAAAAVLCAAALVGFVPALHVTRASASVASFGRGTSDSVATRRFRSVLVVGEVALSTCLVIGAALFLASLVRLQRSSVGFEPGGVAAGSVTLPAEAYPTPDRQAAFFADVVERVRQAPQVTGAAIAFGLPFDSDNYVSPYVISGQPIVPPADRARAGLRIVGEDYFRVMRARLLAGRPFSAADRAGAHGVCIINASLARRQFAGRSPIGAVILRGHDANAPFEIIGVVEDVRTNGPLQDAPDEVFLPFRQVPRPNAWIVVRSAARPDALGPVLQSAVGAIDPDLPIAQFATMDERLATTVGPQRIVAGLTSTFAVLALLLAAIGLYAVLAHSVASRTVEIGIRMAVGADRRSILALVVAGGLRLVGAGLLCGLGAACALSRLAASQLYGVSARDPAIYGVVAVLFAVVGIAASILPARRATRVDPLIALTS